MTPTERQRLLDEHGELVQTGANSERLDELELILSHSRPAVEWPDQQCN